ncbi:excalibur calcium-binding domain-containing protein [Ornithinimicrobium murale]|uniref:excalibur calcium-binding domain-containing protein n=1 Tax=Ornithinimicrobium murale TaxID=1050153 RepID=UPI000E0D9CBF|nr:excalibur calcium-binding domain-containing protein [Ornithinimicrobium murale]
MSLPRTASLAATTALGLLLLAPVGAANASGTAPVTPAPPVFTDACGTDNDQVLIPFTEGVVYYLGGVKVNPGVREINPSSPRAQVFTRAADGYELTSPATWGHTYDAERGCDGEAYVKTGNEEPEAPVKDDDEVFYKDCIAVEDAGMNPLNANDPGYGAHLDPDGDGIACDEDSTVIIGNDGDDEDETVVISDDDERLPDTGFASDAITLIGATALLGVGGLALNSRRLNRMAS